MTGDPLRDHLIRLLDWEDAHVTFDAATSGIPEKLRGTQPKGLPYSSWQLLEHLRLTQRDILDFCQNEQYEQPTWPDDYWPSAAAPPNENAWDESIAQLRADRKTLKELAASPTTDLFKVIPRGTGQTYLREILLVADHNAYHVGELIVVRRLLGIWPEA